MGRRVYLAERQGKRMTAEQRQRELPKAIIKWYEIKKESRAEIPCAISVAQAVPAIPSPRERTR